jgi:hypothetical protein
LPVVCSSDFWLIIDRQATVMQSSISAKGHLYMSKRHLGGCLRLEDFEH